MNNALTPREHEVAQLIAHGYGNNEIAELLDVSTKTVETHKYRIFEKLGVSRRHGLVRHAIEQGWMKEPLSL